MSEHDIVAAPEPPEPPEPSAVPGVAASAGIQVVRLGHGANCSSLGSVIDTLFVTAVIGGAVFAAVAGALEREVPRAIAEAAPDERVEREDATPPEDSP